MRFRLPSSWLRGALAAAAVAVAVPAASSGTDERNHTAREFQNWMRAQVEAARPEPGGFLGRINQTELCQRVEAISPQLFPESWDAIITQPFGAEIVAADWRLAEWRTTNPFFVPFVIREACHSAEFDIYDPAPGRLIAHPTPDSGATAEMIEAHRQRMLAYGDHVHGFPACPDGPRLALSADDVWLLTQAIRSFDRLKSLTIACVAVKPRDRGWFRALSGTIEQVRVLNATLDVLDWHSGRIENLTVIGTLDPNRPAQASNHAFSIAPGRAPLSAWPGTRIQSLVISRSRGTSITIGGSAISHVLVANGELSGGIVVGRSEVGVLQVSDTRADTIEVWETRVGPGAPERGHAAPQGALHLTGNTLRGSLLLGRRGQLAESMVGETSFMREVMANEAINSYGPVPPWLNQTEFGHKRLLVRGYVALGSTKIGGDLEIAALDLAGADLPQSEAGGGRSVPPNRGTFLNMHSLEARNVIIDGSFIRFGLLQGLVAANLRLTQDFIVRGSALIWRDGDETGASMPNRPTGEPHIDGKQGFTFGFSHSNVRNLALQSSLITGPVAITDSTIQSIWIADPSRKNLLEPSGSHVCTAPLASDDQRSDRSNVARGGVWIASPWPYYPGELRHPPCYGSIVVTATTVDTITAVGRLTDIIVMNSDVTRSVQIGGRVSGTINLSNLVAKDGAVILGQRDQPLIWCRYAGFFVDGARLGSLQADRASFRRYDCEAQDPERVIGTVPISMRAARIEQFVGLPRMTAHDPADAGLLGLETQELISIALPAVAHSTRTAAANLEPEASRAPFDPQTLSDLSRRLREAGYPAKATELAIERLRRQKAESDDVLDRVKLVAGWPVSWGYQTEYVFLYCIIVIFVGAWVSAYYRENASMNPPDDEWLSRHQAKDPGHGPLDFFGAALKLTGLIAVSIALYIAVTRTDVTNPGLAWLVLLSVPIVVGSAVFLWSRGFAPVERAEVRRVSLFLASLRSIDFHAFFFSLDRFLPAPGFHGYWSNYPRIGQAGRNYFYIHRLTGLLLVSLIAASVTGLFE